MTKQALLLAMMTVAQSSWADMNVGKPATPCDVDPIDVTASMQYKDAYCAGLTEIFQQKTAKDNSVLALNKDVTSVRQLKIDKISVLYVEKTYLIEKQEFALTAQGNVYFSYLDQNNKEQAGSTYSMAAILDNQGNFLGSGDDIKNTVVYQPSTKMAICDLKTDIQSGNTAIHQLLIQAASDATVTAGKGSPRTLMLLGKNGEKIPAGDVCYNDFATGEVYCETKDISLQIYVDNTGIGIEHIFGGLVEGMMTLGTLGLINPNDFEPIPRRYNADFVNDPTRVPVWGAKIPFTGASQSLDCHVPMKKKEAKSASIVTVKVQQHSR